ncbi:hypothetical protein V6Z79_000152 [Aspergillus fumigatus]
MLLRLLGRPVEGPNRCRPGCLRSRLRLSLFSKVTLGLAASTWWFIVQIVETIQPVCEPTTEQTSVESIQSNCGRQANSIFKSYHITNYNNFVATLFVQLDLPSPIDCSDAATEPSIGFRTPVTD